MKSGVKRNSVMSKWHALRPMMYWRSCGISSKEPMKPMVDPPESAYYVHGAAPYLRYYYTR